MKVRSVTAIVLATSLVTQTGCSFLFVEGPPARDEIPFRRTDDTFCTEGVGAPVVDSVATGVVPFFGFMSLFNVGGKEVGAAEGAALLTTVLALTGVEAVSAIWGFHTVGKCRRYSAGREGQPDH